MESELDWVSNTEASFDYPDSYPTDYDGDGCKDDSDEDLDDDNDNVLDDDDNAPLNKYSCQDSAVSYTHLRAHETLR